jgi:hypothetical protein
MRFTGRDETKQGDAMLNTLDLNFPLGSEAPVFHCPTCGKQILTQEGTDSCEHLLFIFIPEENLCEYLAPELETLIGNPEEYACEYVESCFLTNFAGLVHNEWQLTPLQVSLTTRGYGCGPTSFTVCLGFELSSEGREVYLELADRPCIGIA